MPLKSIPQFGVIQTVKSNQVCNTKATKRSNTATLRNRKIVLSFRCVSIVFCLILVIFSMDMMNPRTCFEVFYRQRIFINCRQSAMRSVLFSVNYIIVVNNIMWYFSGSRLMNKQCISSCLFSISTNKRINNGLS